MSVGVLTNRFSCRKMVLAGASSNFAGRGGSQPALRHRTFPWSERIVAFGPSIWCLGPGPNDFFLNNVLSLQDMFAIE